MADQALWGIVALLIGFLSGIIFMACQIKYLITTGKLNWHKESEQPLGVKNE